MTERITRHNFFHGETQHERFTEHAPLCVEDVSHDLCNCTKTVTERPAGEPESVSQIIEFAETIGKYRMRLEMVSHFQGGERYSASDTHEDSAVNFWIHWPRSETKPAPRFGNKEDEHAYFWFSRENSLQVQVSGTGDGFKAREGVDALDCTLGHVYFGNNVDVSRLFNGFSASRVVDLSKIDAGDVWTHHCSFGAESWSKITIKHEVERLQRLRALAARIHGDVAPCNIVNLDVEDVRERVIATETSRWLASDAFQLIEKMLIGFQDSDLRKDLTRVSEEATAMLIAKSKVERSR